MSTTKIIPVPRYPSFQLEVIKLATGFLARPLGQSGNIGNSPFLWIAAVSNTANKAANRFAATHAEDLEKWQSDQLATRRSKKDENK